MGLSFQAQEYKVSTAVQPKHVLLEEFTAIRCGYCPDGHQKAEELKQILGDRVSVVAIHCGYLSRPGAYEPDFRVEAGEILGDFLGGAYGSFPSGSVNRRDWQGDGTYPCSRGQWKGQARQIVTEQAPVNLWAKAQIDAKTRQLKVEVQGYFTDNVTGEMPRLNVLLTQNNVLGLQYGGGMGDRYPHQHMLRDAITDATGEELAVHEKGEYFKKEYTYTLPQQFKEIAVDMTELELVAFVTRGKFDVLNVLTVKPDYVGETLPLRAVIDHHRLPVGDGYSYHFIPLMLTNKSNVPITSAQFYVTLNGESVESEWQGEVAPFATKEIRVPIAWNAHLKSDNTYLVLIHTVNGQSIEGNAIGGSFLAPYRLPVALTLRINTDEHAAENTYCLYDMDGRVVKNFGPFSDGNLLHYEEQLSLQPNTTYCLEVTDAWGNGIYTNGNAIELANKAGLVLLSQTVIQNFGQRLFFTTDMASGVPGVPSQQQGAVVYDLMGHRVAMLADEAEIAHLQLRPGVYVLQTAKETKKIVVR